MGAPPEIWRPRQRCQDPENQTIGELLVLLIPDRPFVLIPRFVFDAVVRIEHRERVLRAQLIWLVNPIDLWAGYPIWRTIELLGRETRSRYRRLRRVPAALDTQSSATIERMMRSLSNHASSVTRREAPRRDAMPLRISPSVRTLRYNRFSSTESIQITTLGSGLGLTSSEMMLVSSRKPLTARRPGRSPVSA
jgi:hypothetical protein